MFYFYGSKKALARRYDAPVFPLVVEPFAGAAAYTIHHLLSVDRALLVEKDPRVVELWRRLLAMEPEAVLSLKVPVAGEETADFLHMTAAASNAIGHSRRMTVTERMPDKIKAMRENVARVVRQAAAKVELVCGDYRDAPDVEATWFVDPPYQPTRGDGWSQGLGYAPGCSSREIDYAELGEWCRSRRGQVIVCEQEGADWLPFRPLWASRDSVAVGRREVVWTSAGNGQPVLGAARPPRRSRNVSSRLVRARECQVCRTRFAPKRSDARYCSAACRQRSFRARSKEDELVRELEAARRRYWELARTLAIARSAPPSAPG